MAKSTKRRKPRPRQDFIVYELAEAALFEAIRPQLRLLALDYAHHFGADVAGHVADFAEAIFPKAERILARARPPARCLATPTFGPSARSGPRGGVRRIARQHRPRRAYPFQRRGRSLGP